MATTRLRRTFQYPVDDDDIPKDLDEEGDYSREIVWGGFVLMLAPRAREAHRQVQSRR